MLDSRWWHVCHRSWNNGNELNPVVAGVTCPALPVIHMFHDVIVSQVGKCDHIRFQKKLPRASYATIDPYAEVQHVVQRPHMACVSLGVIDAMMASMWETHVLPSVSDLAVASADVLRARLCKCITVPVAVSSFPHSLA